MVIEGWEIQVLTWERIDFFIHMGQPHGGGVGVKSRGVRPSTPGLVRRGAWSWRSTIRIMGKLERVARICDGVPVGCRL
jgi:hypothetical protein